MQVVDSEGYLKVKLVGGPVGPFVPYTGATANVDLGEYEIKAGQFTLDTSPTGTAAVGTTRWNDSIGSSETTLKGGSVILKNGVDLVARVVNKVTPNATLTKANYTAVRISGAQGQRLAVAYAQANNDANSADTIGLVTETIPTNQEGFIITVGNLEGVNTTGALQGETWADGDVLYLSPTTPGAITNIKPTGLTGHIVVIGYVEYAHAINGKIYVKIMNGWELDELHNVYINPLTLANNNILQYDSSTQLWRNQVLSTGITIGSTAIASGTIGRVLFQGTGNVVQESSSLFWDATNNRLGIGTETPSSPLHVIGSATSGFDAIRFKGQYSETGYLATSNGAVYFASGAGVTGSFLELSSAVANLRGGTTAVTFTVGSERMRVNNAGNVLIGTTTDAGFRLDVNGTARVSGVTTLATANITGGGNQLGVGLSNTDSYYRAGINGNLGVTGLIVLSTDVSGNGTPVYLQRTASLFNVFSTLPITFSVGSERMRIFSSTGNIGINTTTDAGFKLDVNGTARIDQTLQLNATGTGTAITMGGNIGRFTIDGTFIRFKVTGGGDLLNMTQNFLGINATAVIPSAIMAINSTNRGFLPPRMDTTQKNAIATPATGLMVYDNVLNRPCFYDGTTWITL